MAEKDTKATKTLEMRVAELEDKLSQVHITEEEMATYNKVASAIGGGGVAAAAGSDVALTPHPDSCVVNCIRACTVRACTVRACTIRACTVVSQCIRQTIVQQCIQPCVNECGGGWGGGFSGGGDFGGLGG